MGKFIDLTGVRFNRLTVIKRAGYKGKRILWLCKCSCGEETIVVGANLKNGNTKSCGCYGLESSSRNMKKFLENNIGENHTNYKHGVSGDRFYRTWTSLKERCNNKKSTTFKYYGYRGIKISKDWNDFGVFKNDMYKNYLKHSEKYGEKNTTIDRVDNNGNYCKENCRWATKFIQDRNKRNNRFIEFNGERMLLIDWSKKLGIRRRTLWCRINKYNWSIKKALTTPVLNKK